MINVVWLWYDGDRNFERKLKNQKNAPRLCPVCNRKKTNKWLKIVK